VSNTRPVPCMNFLTERPSHRLVRWCGTNAVAA